MALGGLAVAAPPAHAESFTISIYDQAHDASSGEVFGQYPIVQVVGDLSGSPKVGWTVIASVSGTGASLVGTASQTTDSNGRAQFTDLGISALAGTYTLRFTTTAGTTKSASQQITVSPGPAVALEVGTARAGATTP